MLYYPYKIITAKEEVLSMQIRPDKSEHVLYNKSDFPVYIRLGILSQYPDYAAESHWHDDIEFILILSGSMDYNINGEITTLSQGEGIFVNSRQFHYGFSGEHQECVFICILLHPALLCSTQYIEQKYVQPITTNFALPYYKFSPNCTWEKRVLDYLSEMYKYRDADTMELRAQSLFGCLWVELYTNLNTQKSESPLHKQHLTALRHMISYIQNHYKEKISLADLCNTGNVGKTTCSTIFMKYTNQTPIEYLTDYRLRKSIDLMTSTDMTLYEIACETGFAGASYFAETFRRHFGNSPGEYRRQLVSSQ
jgi:AraC-like DNA-binding protein/mannose-6-phosphate isomerase-like protein (cupin superfamily)